MDKINKVLYNVDQTPDTGVDERRMARKNIGLNEVIGHATTDDDTGIAPLGTNGLVPAEFLPAGPTYSAGYGISINAEKAISVDSSVISPKLFAGTNVTIDSNNVISATDTTYDVFTPTENGLVPKADGSNDDAKFLCGDGTWQPPMAGDAGDVDHPNYITVDSYGNLRYARNKRLFWEFTFNHPSTVLTETDISNGYVELVLQLGENGLGIMHNGNMVCMKGYLIENANSLDDRQLSFYLLAHDGTSPRFLMDTGFTTYTETVQGGYHWKAFKAVGLCAARNITLVDAVLRVPLTTEEEVGQTFRIQGEICVSVFGVAGYDN